MAESTSDSGGTTVTIEDDPDTKPHALPLCRECKRPTVRGMPWGMPWPQFCCEMPGKWGYCVGNKDSAAGELRGRMVWGWPDAWW